MTRRLVLQWQVPAVADAEAEVRTLVLARSRWLSDLGLTVGPELALWVGGDDEAPMLVAALECVVPDDFTSDDLAALQRELGVPE